MKRSTSLEEAEVRLRKLIASNPESLSYWYKLIDLLCVQKNYVEALLQCRLLLTRNPRSWLGQLLTARVYYHSCDFNMAWQAYASLAPYLNKLSAGDQDIIRDLAILHKHSSLELGEISLAFVLDSEIHKFNWTKGSISGKVDIVFYLRHPFHLSIQKRIAECAHLLGISCIYTRNIKTIIGVAPSIVVTSEALYADLSVIRSSLPTTTIVNTRHGLGDKNHAALGASRSDFICVSSEFIKRLFVDQYLTPESKVWVTGYPQMDSILQKIAISRSLDDAAPRSVLFAPTYNPGLSAALMLGEDLVELIRGDDATIAIDIRPHPRLIQERPKLISAWLNKYSSCHNVRFHLSEDMDVTELFLSNAILISDVSSVAISWLVIDRPFICLVDRQAATSSSKYAPTGLEWLIHRAACLVEDKNMLKDAVRHLLVTPTYKQVPRKEWSEKIFGDFTDGRASERILKRIISLLNEK